MRRIYWRYGVVTVALLALVTWSGSSFGRDKDKDASNDSQSNSANASNDDSSSKNSDDQNRTDRRNQDRDQADDAQHHAALGISVTDNDGRVRVVAILPGSPAAKAGLQNGDEIRYVDDQRIRTAEGLTDEVGEKQPGSNVELSIRRNGERRTLQARLASSQEMGASRWQNNRQYAANDNNDRGNRWNQNNGNQQGWNRNRASSYDPSAQGNQQSVNQQIRTLRQQVAQLQQEVDDLRNQQAGGSRVGYRNRSNNASRDGNQNGHDRNDQDSD